MPVIAPLFDVKAVDWTLLAATQFDAIMMTSANAARYGGAQLQHYTHLPLYAVGGITASAAQHAQFADVRVGQSDVAALLDQISRDGVQRVLHLTGQDFIATMRPEIEITRCIVYAATVIDPPPKLPSDAVILVHSPRAGARLASIISPEQRHRYAIIAISPATAKATGAGWHLIHHADQPSDDALLARAVELCKLG